MLVYYFSNLVSNDFNVFDKIKKFFQNVSHFFYVFTFFRVFLFSFPVLLNNNPQQQYGSITK